MKIGDACKFRSCIGDLYDATVVELRGDDVILEVFMPSTKSSSVRLTCFAGVDGEFHHRYSWREKGK